MYISTVEQSNIETEKYLQLRSFFKKNRLIKITIIKNENSIGVTVYGIDVFAMTTFILV